MNIEIIISLIALAVAVASFLTGYYWHIRKHQHELGQSVEGWTETVRNWAVASIEVMTRIHHEFNTKDHEKAVNAARSLALELQCLIDQGRLYFPNENRDVYGHRKQLSRQGYRSAILDTLVATQKVATGTKIPFDWNDDKGRYGSNKESKAIKLYINAFISMIEVVLRTRETNLRLIKNLRQSGRNNEADRVERLLIPSNKNPPPGHRYWLGEENTNPEIPSEGDIFRENTRNNP